MQSWSVLGRTVQLCLRGGAVAGRVRSISCTRVGLVRRIWLARKILAAELFARPDAHSSKKQRSDTQLAPCLCTVRRAAAL